MVRNLKNFGKHYSSQASQKERIFRSELFEPWSKFTIHMASHFFYKERYGSSCQGQSCRDFLKVRISKNIGLR